MLCVEMKGDPYKNIWFFAWVRYGNVYGPRDTYLDLAYLDILSRLINTTSQYKIYRLINI